MAADQIKRLEELSSLYGMPAIVAMVANSGDEMKGYVDFFVETTDMPFAIDMWNLEPRMEATRYVAELGLQDKLLYNSVTVWSPDVPAEVEQIKELGIKHVVTVVMDMVNQLPSGRISVPGRHAGQARAGQLREHPGGHLGDEPAVHRHLRPLQPADQGEVRSAGRARLRPTAPTCGRSPRGRTTRTTWGETAFIGLDAGTHAATIALWGDFIFSGPMWGNDHVFPAVAAAHAMVSTMNYAETGTLTGNESAPVYKLFPDFVKTLEGRSLD